MSKTYKTVYALQDKNGRTRYIGKADVFENRMASHQRTMDMIMNPPALYRFLCEEGLNYKIVYQGDDYLAVEKNMIKKMSKTHNLFNITFNPQGGV